MTRTPDEIKKGLECCSHVGRCMHGCPYYISHNVPACTLHKSRDALALIQQLQAQNAEQAERIKQLEAERDAAIEALKSFGGCMACTSANVLKRDSPCKECISNGQVTRDYWQWRGVQKEN